MISIIAYVPDHAAMVIELQEHFPELVSPVIPATIDPDTGESIPGDLGGELFFQKSPTVSNLTGESMFVVLADDVLIGKFETLQTLQMLGTYEDVFGTPELLAIYDSVYDRTPKTFTDHETGEEITYTPPKKFGVFA